MREFTFFRGKEAGFLDVRSSDLVFHLQAPNLIQLVSQRVKYVESYLEKDYRYGQWKSRVDWPTFSENIQKHVSTIKNVYLQQDQGPELLKLLDAVSWHDVRLFLQILEQVHVTLGSTETNWSVDELLAILMTPLKSIGALPLITNVFGHQSSLQEFLLKGSMSIVVAVWTANE